MVCHHNLKSSFNKQPNARTLAQLVKASASLSEIRGFGTPFDITTDEAPILHWVDYLGVDRSLKEDNGFPLSLYLGVGDLYLGVEVSWSPEDQSRRL